MATQLPFQRTFEDLIEDILLQVVSIPDDLEVWEIPSREQNNGNSLFIKIRCNKRDRGKVIGKKGTFINALHTILIGITGGGWKVNLELDEGNDRDEQEK